MRTLLLLRGAPGSGKSTWVKENKLEPYTISADAIRLLFQSPVYDPETGYCGISQNNDKAVWKFLYDRVEERMSRGEFIVIDATNKSVRKWKEYADKYRYRVFVKQFDTPLKECIKRNSKREAWKYVPVNIIVAMYEKLKQETVPSWAKQIDSMAELTITPADFNGYRNIYLFGDIHGCFEPLQKFFADHPYSEEDAYIFLGDYLDRGIQNAEVLKFLMQFTNKKNVIFLEGNHVWERHWAKGHNDRIRSGEFLEKTMPQLEAAGIDKAEVRNWTQRWSQLCYFEYRGQKFLATHAGLGFMPDADEFIKIPTFDMIKGRSYGDDVDAMWEDKMWNSDISGDGSEIVIQIHGHRNKSNYRPHDMLYSFNLCSPVEFGEPLQVLELRGGGRYTYSIKHIELENTVFNPDLTLPAAVTDKKREMVEASEDVSNTPVGNLIRKLRAASDVVEKRMGDDISSFCFKRSVFYSGKWSELSMIARGLFINTKTEDIVARSYPKFFNIDERPDTKLDVLKDTLKFPVSCYEKYNGYLGLVSYDKVHDKLMFASKSSTHSWFAANLKQLFEELLTEKSQQYITEYLKTHNYTFVFEVVDPVNDPHIIHYNNCHLVLLDAVDNSVDFGKLSYEDLVALSDTLGVECKARHLIAHDWNELNANLLVGKTNTEGWVIEDSSGFMLKYKTPYYKWWKFARGYLQKLQTDGNIDKVNPEFVPIVEFMKELKCSGELPDNIIKVRNMWEMRGKQ